MRIGDNNNNLNIFCLTYMEIRTHTRICNYFVFLETGSFSARIKSKLLVFSDLDINLNHRILLSSGIQSIKVLGFHHVYVERKRK